MSRLATGGLIDRTTPLSFTFDNRVYGGFAGDTLASALIANDVQLVGRSFKYHRPRGTLTAGSEEPNALVTLRSGAYTEPNTRATTTELFDGLVAASQNRWPSLACDVLAINQLFAPVLGAGFYYKTFMWPASWWEKLYEPLIRRAAGLGALSGRPDPDRYDRTHAFCDLLVIGGGPAGLAAALVAGRAGLRVIVVNEDAEFGGRLLAERLEIDGQPGPRWAREVVAELATLPEVTLLPRAFVFGVYDGREYGALERLADHLAVAAEGKPRQRLWKIIAKRAVLATGAIERPLVFSGNDRPGVMMASGVSTYVNRFAAAPGQRAAIFTVTDSGWHTAQDLVAAGVEVAAVIDARSQEHSFATMLRGKGVECLSGVVESVQGSRVRRLTVRLSNGKTRRLDVDLLAMAGGWNPAIGIASNLGARPEWSDEINSFVIGIPPPGMVAAGAAAGHLSLAQALADGAEAACRAIDSLGFGHQRPPHWRASGEMCAMTPLWHVRGGRSKAFVDFQHDVTADDVVLAAREGFVSVEHLKRYTTLGMATDQGKVSHLNGHALLAAATGRTIAQSGTIMSRPPYLPVAIGALAGHQRERNYRPVRRLAAHEWAAQQGATFADAGLWRRPRWFAKSGEQTWRETVNREVMAVRDGVGVCDISTLGKIELYGRDAARLLDRIYINTLSTLPVGKARYGVMLREDGIVLDDGTVTRLGDEHFYLTTTTANAGKVMQHIDFARQVIWPALDTHALSVSEQWAKYAVAGPRSRELLQNVLSGVDLSNESLPFMGAREFRWQGKAARVFRVSFSGELAYEVSVPSTLGDQFIRILFQAGRSLGVVAYGTECQSVMRIEKGHVAGPELNGQTSAADLSLGHMMCRKKQCIGQVLARRPAMTDPDRPTLVGIKPLRQGDPILAGAHLMSAQGNSSPANNQGWISSATYSPNLGHWIALAFVKRGPQRHGERLRLYDALRKVQSEVEVCARVFFDPEGARLRG